MYESTDFIRHRRFRSPCHRKGHRRHAGIQGRGSSHAGCLRLYQQPDQTTIDKGHLFSSKHMQTLYRLVYQLAENNGASYFNSAPSIINIINALGASKFAKVIANHVPDVIICTHVFAAQMVDELKSAKNSPISRPSALLPTTRSTRTGRMCRACSTSSPRVNCSPTAVCSAAFRRTASCRSAFRVHPKFNESCPARTRRHSSALTRK